MSKVLILNLRRAVYPIDLQTGVPSRPVFHLLVTFQYLRESSLRPLIILRDPWLRSVIIYRAALLRKQILWALLFPGPHLILESFAVSARHSVSLLVFTVFLLRDLEVSLALIHARKELLVRRLHIKLLHLEHEVWIIKSLQICRRPPITALISNYIFVQGWRIYVAFLADLVLRLIRLQLDLLPSTVHLIISLFLLSVLLEYLFVMGGLVLVYCI
jgi:hypothetical protein